MAREDKIIIDNPFDRVSEDYKHESKEMNPFEDFELSMFLISAEQDAYYPYWYLLSHTGIRRGEGLALTWSDINFANNTISINKSLNEKLVVSKPKTKNSKRTLKVGDDLMEILKNHRIKIMEKTALTEYFQDNNLVFPNVMGTHMNPNNLARRNFKAILQRAGLKDRVIHDLRHTFATLYIHKTKDIAGCSAFLGHDKKSVTLDFYTDYLPKEDESPAQVMSEIVKTSRKDEFWKWKATKMSTKK